MKPVRLSRNFFSLHAYSFWKVCHPLRLKVEEISELVTLFDYKALDQFEKLYIHFRPASKNFQYEQKKI